MVSKRLKALAFGLTLIGTFAVVASSQAETATNSALLIMDVQGPTVKMIKDSDHYLAGLNKAIASARRNKIPVIYVTVGFRKGYPEISENNKMFSMLRNNPQLSLDNEDSYRVYSTVAPQAGDIWVTKRRVSAFSGSDLEVVLRSLGVKRIVLAGISTSGVVLSTTREAADMDYAITVLSDGCADGDEEVQKVLLTKVLAGQADIMKIDEWVASNNAH